jgi:two-component system, chemotaxis family, response regulator WspF
MKIGIVNDLAMATEALKRALALQPAHQVIWTAKNGAEAIEKCAAATPDLVLMDLLMPGMDGVEATKRIMARSPCAILVVTASVGANAWRVFEAMGHGALDAVDTPVLGGRDLRVGAANLLAKIETVERLIGPHRATPWVTGRLSVTMKQPSPHKLVAIGASAGGPAALAEVLGGLPKDLPAAVVIVQHVDVQFAAGMAVWLDQNSTLPVRLAQVGDRPEKGTVLLAGTNDHLVLNEAGRLEYTPDPREYVYRPSVDVFFQSATRYWSQPIVGVLLTGMGRDGAVGLKALRNQGHYTITQDAATSAVYGMPKAAVTLEAAVDVLPLDRIAAKVTASIGSGR